MIARSTIVGPLTGIALWTVVLVSQDVAKAPAQMQQQVIGRRVTEARIAMLREQVRRYASSVKREDLAKMAVPGKPVMSRIALEKVKQFKFQHAQNDKETHKGKQNAKESGQTKTETNAKKPSSDGNSLGTKPRPRPLSPGYYPDVRVLAPGRLDWTFVVSPNSFDPEPSAMTRGYDSTRQAYELFVPPRRLAGGPYALILNVPTGIRSSGWGSWQGVCRLHGVVFAGVHHAGNTVPMALRARIVLDVLDDVRRRFNIDPDRTYITGHSGAGHAASSIAYALPELFGGQIPICGSWNLRVERMLRQRVFERQSVAVLTGEFDFNRPELQREFFPILRDYQIRSQLWVYPRMAHAMPKDAQLEEVFQWVEAGLPQRRQISALLPAGRLADALSAADWSLAVLTEAGERLETPGLELSGLFMLHAVTTRWPGSPAANVAQVLQDEFDAASPVPSKEIYRMERLSFRYLQARMFDGIVNSPPPPNYPVPRINLITIALALWEEIAELAPPQSPVALEANARLLVLRRQAGR